MPSLRDQPDAGADPGAAREARADTLSDRLRRGATVRQAAVTLSDLAADMPWLVLGRAVPMAMRPERLGRALATIAALLAVWAALRPLTGPPNRVMAEPVVSDVLALYGSTLERLANDLEAGAWLQLGTWLNTALVQVPAELWLAHGWALVPYAVAGLGVLGVSGLASARSAALEAGLRATSKPGWAPVPRARPRPLLFAVRHAPAALGAMGLVLAGPLAAVLVTAGFGLIPRPGGLVGVLLYGLPVLGALAATLLALVAAVSGPLVAPAIACDGDDGLEAAQRAPAYAIARPGTLLGLGLLAAAQGLVLLAVLLIVRSVTLDLAGWLAGPGLLDDARAPRVWGLLTATLVAAGLLSYAQVACTLIYLVLRRVCDGQPLTEVWRSGDAAGVFTLAD